MSRQSGSGGGTDLLDFFGRKPTSGGARAVSRPRPGEREPVVLSRRQASFGLVTVGLLMAVAFLGGLWLGKRGAAAPALVRPAATPAPDTWLLRGCRLPAIGAGADKLETRAVAVVRAAYPNLAPFVDAVPVDAGRGRTIAGQFRLVVRSFESKESAKAWASVLSSLAVDGYSLFRECQPEPTPR